MVVFSTDSLGWKGGLKVRWVMVMYDVMEIVKENIFKFEWLFIVLYGDVDRFVMVEGFKFLEKVVSEDKIIKVS